MAKIAKDTKPKKDPGGKVFFFHFIITTYYIYINIY